MRDRFEKGARFEFGRGMHREDITSQQGKGAREED